jgi:hypothetical protein
VRFAGTVTCFALPTHPRLASTANW